MMTFFGATFEVFKNLGELWFHLLFSVKGTEINNRARAAEDV